MNWFSDKIDEWTGEKRRREERFVNQIKHSIIEKEITDLLLSITEDWRDNKYKDKVESLNGIFKYKMENMNSIEMYSKTLIYFNYKTKDKHTYSLTTSITNAIVDLFNAITEQVNKNETKQRGKVKSDNPKRDLYNTLLENIKHRKNNLDKMEASDSNRAVLENELLIAKNKADKLKEKYNF